MLFEQYSGRQKTYEQTVKFFTGGSLKYSPNPKITIPHSYVTATASTAATANPTATTATSTTTTASTTSTSATATATTTPTFRTFHTPKRPVNQSSLEFKKRFKRKERKGKSVAPTPSTKNNKWQKAIAKDPLSTERIILAFGDASLNWNMPGTLPISLKKLKHHLKMASKRLGVFSNEWLGLDDFDESLVGKKRLEIIEIPEYMTSQVWYSFLNKYLCD